MSANPSEPRPPRDDRRILDMLGGLIESGLERGRLFDLILSMVVESTRAERGFLVRIMKNGERRTEAARNIDSEAIHNPEMKQSSSLVNEVLRTGRTVLVGHARQDGRFQLAPSVVSLDLHSVLVVPIVHRQRVHGVIYLDHRFVDHHFSEDDARLADSFARRCAPLFAHMIAHTETEQALQDTQRLCVEARRELAQRYRYDNLIGQGQEMGEVFRLMEKVIPTDYPVLITGESGTGKELAAKAIHYNGARAEKAFVAENCAALSEALLESELFGHVRGAFTGADKDRTGLFELAHGGTLFLDEIGELALEVQKKLLRTLQEGEIRPLGSSELRRVDVRFIGATNRDLEAEMAAGRFLPDLYHRIAVLRIEMPPLRRRAEDLTLLLEHFLESSSRELKVEQPRLNAAALARLFQHPWPGNVRELRNLAHRLTLLHPGEEVDAQGLLLGEQDADLNPQGAILGLFDLPFQDARYQFIAGYVRRLLAQVGGNITQAAERAGMKRQSLQQVMFRYGVQARDYQPD